MVEKNDPLGILDTTPEDPLGILKKKEDSTPLDSGSEESGTSSGTVDARIAANPFDVYTLGHIKSISDRVKTDKAQERKNNISKFYDTAAESLDAGDALTAYKNWAAQTGSIDRIKHLEEKAKWEQQNAQETSMRLSAVVSEAIRLQEEAKKKGDTAEVERYQKMIDNGREELMRHLPSSQNLRTESMLQLEEEALSFAAEVLHTKIEELNARPDFEEKVNNINALQTELLQSKPSLNDRSGVERYNALIDQYNEALQDPDIQFAERIAKQAEGLVEREKSLAKLYPAEFQKRLEKKAHQQQVDSMFASGEKGPVSGMASQVGRSVTAFVADLAKLWTIGDGDSEFGTRDKFSAVVDSMVDYVNDNLLPVPSDYSSPMVYEDEEGNTVFRTDLILPKAARVGGDMATLLWGAGKLTRLGKLAGASTKTAQGVGLFTSSYVQTYDDYKKAGEAAGMNPDEAAWFASSAAGVTSALELVSPQRYLLGADDLAKNVVKSLKEGVDPKTALREATKAVFKEVGLENIQEITQTFGDLAVEAGANILTGNQYFDHNAKDVMNELVETAVLTSIVSAAPAGAVSTNRLINRTDNYKDAVRVVAENREKYLPMLQEAFKASGIEPAKVQQIMADINAVKVPKDNAPLYLIHGEPVSREAIIERINEGKFNGIYVANDKPLNQQLSQAITEQQNYLEQLLTEDMGAINELSELTLKNMDGLPVIRQSQMRKEIDRLVNEGDMEIAESGAPIAKTAKGLKGLKRVLRENARYRVGVGGVLAKRIDTIEPSPEALERLRKEGKEIDPEKEAKAIARAKIDELAKQGHVKLSGNRVVTLTDEGQQKIAMIMDEMHGRMRVDREALDGVRRYELGITSATDKLPDIKALMDEARAAEERGDNEAAQQAYNKVLDVGESTINNLLSVVPSAKVKLDRTLGNFFGYTEPTFKGELEVAPQDVALAHAALAQAGLDMNQDAIHISQVKPRLEAGENFGEELSDGSVYEPNIDFQFDQEITDTQMRELVQAVQKEAGLAGFTLHPDRKGINLYNISRFTPYGEFIAKTQALKRILDSRGIRFMVRKGVRRLYNIGRPDSGATRTYEQVRGDLLQQAQERRGQEVNSGQANQTSQTRVLDGQHVSVQAGNTGAPEGTETDGQGVRQEAEDPEIDRIYSVMEKATKALRRVRPDLRVVYYRGEKEGAAALAGINPEGKLPKNSKGFYDHDSGLIGIDLTKADATTAFHEAFHPIVDAIRATHPRLFEKLSEQAANQRIELQDGSITTYGEYTDGNKEEALVEFLADFADGKFDQVNNPEGIAQKVKNIINRILKAIGLKSEDLNIDLNRMQDLRGLADDLATAISQGRTINIKRKVDEAKRRKTSGQVEGKARKRLNRTAKRIAVDAETRFKKLQTDIIENPESYMYTPQDLKGMKGRLEDMTIEEVVAQTANTAKLIEALEHNNQFAVLSAIELLNRYNAEGLDTRPIFKKLRRLGTSVGQLLRQFGELKTKTPEGIVDIVTGAAESLGLPPTIEQNDKLKELAKAYLDAQGEVEKARQAFMKDYSEANEKALDEAQDRLAKAFYDLNMYASKVVPLGLDNLVPMILQGNLLTVKSIVVNVVSNLLQQPVRGAELFIGDIASYAAGKFNGDPVVNPFSMWFGATFEGMKAFSRAIPSAIADITKGQNAELTSTLEVRRNLKPWQALQQLLTKEGRATLPRNLKGRVPFRVYFEKMLEGTFGWPAELGFRMLYLGDKPFREAARTAAAYRLFAQRGGGNSAQFRRFMASLTAKDKELIQKSAEEATFSDKRTGSKIADQLMAAVGNGIEAIAETLPANSSLRYSAVTLMKVLHKANTPFVRVPSNLLQYLVELALPILPMFGSVRYFQQGDVRKGSALLTRAAVGWALGMAADMMWDAGILLASGDDDTEAERQLKHEVGRPNGINLSAFARWRNGGDPTFEEGDEIIEFTKLGIFGMYMAYRAEFNEGLEKELKMKRAEVDWSTELMERLNSILGASLEMSFLQGSYNMLKAFENGGFQDYGAELMNTLSAVFIPNNVAMLARARGEYILRAKDKEALNGFIEKQKVKILPIFGIENIPNIYPIIGMFGEPARQTPQGKNPYIYQFFNIVNNEKITDPLAVEVFNVSQAVGKVPMSAPSPRFKIGTTTYTMTERDYTYAQMVAGRIKATVLSNTIATQDWQNLEPEYKAAVIEKINEKANEQAKKIIMAQFAEAWQADRVVTDERLGTYNYVEPEDFDYLFVDKLMNPR